MVFPFLKFNWNSLLKIILLVTFHLPKSKKVISAIFSLSLVDWFWGNKKECVYTVEKIWKIRVKSEEQKPAIILPPKNNHFYEYLFFLEFSNIFIV